MTNAKIIIVDDEEELRENLTDLLEFKGYEVVSYATGEDMVAAFENESPDLVLLDIQLPGIDGIEVLRIIKEKQPHLPVVMVSASSVKNILEQAKTLGALKTVLKPYTHSDILSTIEDALQTKE